MGALRFVIRICIYVIVAAASCAALYGIVRAGQNFDDVDKPIVSTKSNCLLFVDKDGSPGKQGWCKYVEFSSASQLVLAVVLGVVVIIRLCRLKGDTSSFMAFIELLIVIPSFLVAVSGGGVTAAGLLRTCNNLKEGIAAPAWTTCSKAIEQIYQEDIYKLLNLTEIALWITCVWFVHIILSAIDTCSWRKKKREPVGNDDTVKMEKYKKMGSTSSV